MRHSLNTLAVAVVLIGGVSSAASATPLPVSSPLAIDSAQSLAEPVSFRRAHWRVDSLCRKGGRYYTYGGGWGCDYYLYGLWPTRPPRRW